MVLTTALICVVVVLWYLWRKKHLSTFKNLGISGPEPGLFFGNILELYYKGPVKCHEEWVKKYGRVLGYYYGMTPVLLIADPSLIKNIFIKDFSKFINREAFNPLFIYRPHNIYGQSIINLEGKKWKDVRSGLTPTFTTAKIKQMASSINSSIEDMVNILKERAESGVVFDILDTYQRVTMDVITKTVFGFCTDVQTNFKCKLLRATQTFFKTSYRDPIIFLGLCFPYLNYICRKMQMAVFRILNKGVRPELLLRNGLVEVLRHRKENSQGSKCDLLQLLIETKIYTDSKEVDVKALEMGSTESEANFNKEDDTNRKYRKIEDREIVSTSISVLMAGYETTSTTLAFTTYFLAKYPEIQEKLHEEVREVIQNGQNLEYATVNKLQYLDKVLNETLRIYPPVNLFTNRFALEDVEYGDLKIPKGMLIQAPVYLLHHDPDFWEDPEIFDPERFNEKQNTDGVVYMPFGVGPRNCLGMRFAQLEAKLVLAHMINKFKITQPDCQKDHLDTAQRVRNITPKNGVQVQLQLREQEARKFME